MTKDEEFKALQDQIKALQGENAKLVKRVQAKIKPQVSKSRQLTLNGFIGRWPITMTKDEWKALRAEVDTIDAFVEEHDDELINRDQVPAKTGTGE